MILDQNTIVLNPCNGFYDEYNLASKLQADKVNNDAESTASITVPICILPGAIVGQANIDPIFDVKKYPFYVTEPGMPAEAAAEKFYADLQKAKDAVNGKAAVPATDDAPAQEAIPADGGQALELFYQKFPKLHVITAGYAGEEVSGDDAVNALNAVEILILVENALLGKGIHSLYFPGERTPVYSPVSGDRYLARCVPGEYTEGQPLYLTDYSKEVQLGDGDTRIIRGYYFCGADATDDDGNPIVRSSEIKAFAGENFIAPKESNANRKPYPYFRDIIDDSTTERPATTNINGALTNLLRVRMA